MMRSFSNLRRRACLYQEPKHWFTKEVISEIIFNTSMTGYLEVLTDPSYAGQAVCMTYPLIGNYGICYDDQESLRPWPGWLYCKRIIPSPQQLPLPGHHSEFPEKSSIFPGVPGIDTRALTKILREKVP